MDVFLQCQLEFLFGLSRSCPDKIFIQISFHRTESTDNRNQNYASFYVN